MYCEMPKVGSTNWKRVFMKLTNPKYAEIPIEGSKGNILRAERISTRDGGAATSVGRSTGHRL